MKSYISCYGFKDSVQAYNDRKHVRAYFLSFPPRLRPRLQKVSEGYFVRAKIVWLGK